MKTATVYFENQEIVAPIGALLSEVLFLHAPCGGHGICGKCKVKATGSLSPLTSSEKELLTREEIDLGIRLACRVRVEGNCEVYRLSEPMMARVLTDGQERCVLLASPLFSRYGVAIDIGTTTLGARLYDCQGSLLARIGKINSQSAFGADVISRMEMAKRGKADLLAEAILSDLSSMIQQLCSDAGIDGRDIDGAVITGNTVMLHLLTKTNTEPMTRAPFEPSTLFGKTVSAKEIGLLTIHPDASIYLPHCIGAFLGADLVCAILASGMHDQNGATLLCDIGTNGEMALLWEDRLFVCSTAAGPAFEGVGISCGMRGEDGAIDKVWMENGKMRSHVIGEREAVGICGSGMIDAVCCLLLSEQMDETGYLDEETVSLAKGVTILQSDIRAMQLAKSAICAGMQVLMNQAKISVDQITDLYIAGGFANYMDSQNAERIGLIPRGLAGNARPIGNAALDGASALLLDGTLWGKASRIAKQAAAIDLATSAVFARYFTEGMTFPCEG